MLHLLRPVTLTRKNVPGFLEMFKRFAETPAIILSLLEILKKTNLTAIIIQVSVSIDDSSKVFLRVQKVN